MTEINVRQRGLTSSENDLFSLSENECIVHEIVNIFHKCHNSIFILHYFIATSKESAPDIMHSHKKKNK